MKTGLWLAVAFNLAAIAILAGITLANGNGAVGQNPYGSSNGPVQGPVQTILISIPPRQVVSVEPSSRAECCQPEPPNRPAWEPDATPDPSPLPWVILPGEGVRTLP